MQTPDCSYIHHFRKGRAFETPPHTLLAVRSLMQESLAMMIKVSLIWIVLGESRWKCIWAVRVFQCWDPGKLPVTLLTAFLSKCCWGLRPVDFRTGNPQESPYSVPYYGKKILANTRNSFSHSLAKSPFPPLVGHAWRKPPSAFRRFCPGWKDFVPQFSGLEQKLVKALVT